MDISAFTPLIVIAIIKALRTKWPGIDGAHLVLPIACLIGAAVYCGLLMLSTGHVATTDLPIGSGLALAAMGGMTALDRSKSEPNPVIVQNHVAAPATPSASLPAKAAESVAAVAVKLPASSADDPSDIEENNE